MRYMESALSQLKLPSCRWVQSQQKSEIWLDGVEDYVEYAKQISKEFDDVISGDAKKPPVTFGGQTTTTSAAPSGGFFNFSAPAAPAAQPFGSTFGSGAAAAGGSVFKPPADDDGDDEAPQEEDATEPEVDTSKADVLYTKKLHLLTQDPDTKKWKDKGTGIFSLRRSKPTEESSKCVSYIVFTATSGRVLINAPLVKGLKPMVNPKSPANVIMFLISIDEDGSEKKEMHLFKCGSQEVADEVVKKVEEHA